MISYYRLGINLSAACEGKNLQDIKAVLKTGADINYNNDEPLFNACKVGNLEIIDYLIHSKDLAFNSNIWAKNGTLFVFVTKHNNIVVLKYLMHIAEKINPKRVPFEECFICSVENNHDDITKWLIYSNKVQMNHHIDKFLMSLFESKREMVYHWFELKLLHDKLHCDLPSDSGEDNYSKI